MAHRIIAGNDFRLIVCAKRSMGAYLTDMDLSEVDSLRIYMTRAGRSKELQSYTLDENGNAVIYVAAQQVTAGIYGIEMVGVYGDASLRAHLTTAFQIVGAGHGDAGVLTDYSVDIVFAINVAASDVFVKASIEAHNTDPTAHPDIRALIASTRSDLEQAIEEGGADVSEDIQDLQNQINAIVADKATVSLTASPSVVFIGEQKAITLTAKSSPVATSTVIKKGNTQIQTGTTGTVTGSDTITPSGNVSYQAEFVIAGITRTANATVSAVHPIYVGAGATAAAATTKQSAKTSPAGTYTVNVETSGSYVWFLVPNNMSISSAKKNGFDFPLESPTTTTKDGVTYKVYRSSNTYDEGTETIVIS